MSAANAQGRPLKSGDYGPVRVIRGPHAGRIGFYDDDEGSGLIVIILGSPTIASDKAIVLRRNVRRMPDETPIPRFDRWLRRHAAFVRQFDPHWASRLPTEGTTPGSTPRA